MNLVIIIILVVILVLTLSLATLLIYLLQKHRRSVLNNFVKDLNSSYKKSHLNKISAKQLPVDVDEINDDIYFTTKAVIGQYDNPSRVINEKNFNVTGLLADNKLEIYYHYKVVNLGKSKFVPLNKIDLLITKNRLYLYHPLEPETIMIKKIKDLTFFWEKNSLMQRKEFFPGIAFKYQKNSYFLLFQTYHEVLKFLGCINTMQLM